ncbi:cytochrome d ubiquinol oxidase subunit II [Fructilactobacillus fructivorans]|uniref:cytochrome d ubiquinol oxidase subunit II n=1 Tax=Fructilactobacillus fructivorans TaxID=1614 RepID=UPI000710E7B4|nr:cytochrome d ubiquinol oxidase subunit II [Fructilactobacillus fructivorans]KRN41383.1 cytochrome bd-type quinol oxidase, subunit 2 [Fructilactobacillus fructivorans]
MSLLQLLWYFLIGLLFALFLILDGADFGAGMSTRFLATNYDEAALVLRTIGPHWSGNEVFLVAAGGSMFAAMPMWYASLFSGFYLLLFFILVALIFRGVSFEFSENAETRKGRNRWMWANFFGSVFIPFLFGMLFTDMIQRLPMDGQGNIYVSLLNVINPLSVLGGITLTALCLYQGLHYIALHTAGLIRYHASAMASNLYWLAYPVEILVVIALYFQTNFFETHLISTVVVLALIVATTIWGQITSATGHEVQAYLASTSTVALLVILIFVGLFPNLLNTENPAHTISIVNASSSPYTLVVMTIVACILLPIIAIYFTWSYISQFHRISLKDMEDTNSGY